jgi:uncharacterized protein involved in exopolysaccharide biosynthesis
MNRKLVLLTSALLVCMALGALGVRQVLPSRHPTGVAVVQVTHTSDPRIFSDPWFIQTEFEVIDSRLVLSNAIASLKLPGSLGAIRGGLSAQVQRLRRRMRLSVVEQDKIQISVRAETQKIASRTAHAIAAAYCKHLAEEPHGWGGTTARIIGQGSN